jgi:cytochrome c oxidase assembly protein subunit 15
LTRSENNLWLHRFAVLTAVTTLGLIGMGGLVTSHGAGMAVPDWPTSYGYNMFALPFKFWKGGAFYEHTHRLVASGVGLLTTLLAVWLWLKESRRWLRWLGVIAFFAVVLQGVLGGLRVVWFNNEIGIVHAALAQAFFVLICVMALFTSRWWQNSGRAVSPLPAVVPPNAAGAHGVTRPTMLGRLFLFATVMIFLQLVLGATMRHQHAGLAIPDFPLAYGRLWPDTSAAAVARYNAQRVEVTAANPITAFQIGLQMTHRLMALGILVCVGAAAWQVPSWSSRFSVSGGEQSRPGGIELQRLARLALAWFVLILIQAAVGAWTIWSNKAADVTTVHVVVGAVSLAIGGWLTVICARFLGAAGETSRPVEVI